MERESWRSRDSDEGTPVLGAAYINEQGLPDNQHAQELRVS